MQRVNRDKAVKLGCLLVLAVGLTACQSNDEGLNPVNPGKGQSASQSSDTKDGGGERRLTVVKDNPKNQAEEVAIARIHRLAGASIESWLSDDEVKITTTRLVKAGSSTQEPKYAYTTSTVNLSNDEQREQKEQTEQVNSGKIVKETRSPDGKFSFIQKWNDKYSASNFIMNVSTGESIEIKVDNYMESGGWLDNHTYVLAAGSMNGPGEILAITTDGKSSPIKLEDADVEIFNQFKVSHGRLYYVDKNQALKVFEPGQSLPRVLVENAGQVEISPDGVHIAVSTAYSKGAADTKLLMYDAQGNAQGSLIGKGELIPYFNWSPDSSMLAFAVYTEDKSGMNGLYLMDSETGKVSPLGPYYFPQYPLSWNPSGTRLGVTITGDNDLPVTQIIDFK